MHVISNEAVYCFDIDKTLISERRRHADKDDLCVRNPYTGELVFFKAHQGHSDLLKEMHGRNRLVIVWSAAGVQWAKVIVESLGLSAYVHIVMTKPLGYVDDQLASDFMPNRIYLAPEDRT